MLLDDGHTLKGDKLIVKKGKELNKSAICQIIALSSDSIIEKLLLNKDIPGSMALLKYFISLMLEDKLDMSM